MKAQLTDGDFNYLSFEFITGVEWMKKHRIRGMVIGHRIMFAEAGDDVPQKTFRHELQHAYQIMRLGRLRFYITFFLYSLRYGYHKNPFEVEAREHENDRLTIHEEKILWNLRNDCARPQRA